MRRSVRSRSVAVVPPFTNRPTEIIETTALAHERLVATLRDAEWDPAAPSRLPGWTLGHLVTHVARNADALRGMYEAAHRGEVGDQYPGGWEQRAADIDAGAGRDRDALVVDVAHACAALEAAWAATTDDVWASGEGRSLIGPIRLDDWPVRRRREVEVHHVDLGLGFEPQDWSAAFVDTEWPNSVAALAERLPSGTGCVLAPSDAEPVTVGPGGPTVAGTRRTLLAWMLGRAERADAPGITPWG
jgi:maleylpyruvate isomerase